MNDPQQSQHADFHAKHSPSSIKMLSLCPRFANRQTTSDLADEGTMLHASVETGKFEGLTDIQEHYAAVALAYSKPIEDAATKVLKEYRIWNNDPFMRELTHGSPDLIAFAGETHADIVDYKFGRNPVDHAQYNYQAKAYVLAALDTWPALETVTFHFIHPRLADRDSSHTFRRADRDSICAELRAIVEAAEGGAEPTPDTRACIYCKHAFSGGCSALSRELYRIMKLKDIQPIDASTATPEELGKAYEAAAVAEVWAEGQKKAILHRRLEGTEIDGYELKFKKGTRKVVDSGKAWECFWRSTGADHVEEAYESLPAFLEACTVSVTKLEQAAIRDLDKDDKMPTKALLTSQLIKAGAVETSEETSYLAKSK